MIPSVLTTVTPILQPITDILAPIANILFPVALVLAPVANILEPIASATIVQRIAAIFAPVANVLAMVTHILTAVAHILATVPNVFAPVAAVFEMVPHRCTVWASMRMSVLRAQGGRCSSHQGRKGGSHSEITHRIPQRQIPALAVVACAAHSTPPAGKTLSTVPGQKFPVSLTLTA